jgi:hypothetical protein
MFQTIVQYISYASDILPAFFCLPYIKRPMPLWIRVLLIYVIYSFCNDTALLILDSSDNRLSVFYLLSLFTLLEYVAFALVLYLFIDNLVARRTILILSSAFLLFCNIHVFSISVYSFDSLPASIESILLVAFSIYVLYEQMNKPHIIFVYYEPTFWVTVAFILYFSGTLFLFILASNLSREERDQSWTINYCLNILKNILFILAFLFHYKWKRHDMGELV